LLEELLAMMACKAAVKAGQPMTVAEMDDLLRRRLEAEKHSSCPHGRPTTIRLSLRELERQFHRI
jgi:DNA mismatch repair protein MutL